jgi:hypothetical protein
MTTASNFMSTVPTFASLVASSLPAAVVLMGNLLKVGSEHTFALCGPSHEWKSSTGPSLRWQSILREAGEGGGGDKGLLDVAGCHAGPPCRMSVGLSETVAPPSSP